MIEISDVGILIWEVGCNKYTINVGKRQRTEKMAKKQNKNDGVGKLAKCRKTEGGGPKLILKKQSPSKSLLPDLHSSWPEYLKPQNLFLASKYC